MPTTEGPVERSEVMDSAILVDTSPPVSLFEQTRPFTLSDINLERSDYHQEIVNPVIELSDRRILDLPPSPYRWEEDREQIIRTLEAVQAAQMEEVEEKLLTLLQPKVITTPVPVVVENGQQEEVIATESKEQIVKQVPTSHPFEEVLWFVRDEQTNSLREDVFDSEAEAVSIQREVDMQKVAKRLPGSDTEEVKSEIVKGSHKVDWAYQRATEEIGNMGRRSIEQAKKIAREIWAKYTAVKLEKNGNKVDYQQVRLVVNPRESILGADLVERGSVYSKISRPAGSSKIEYQDLAVVVKGEEDPSRKVTEQEVSDFHLTSSRQLTTIQKFPSSLGADWRKFSSVAKQSFGG